MIYISDLSIITYIDLVNMWDNGLNKTKQTTPCMGFVLYVLFLAVHRFQVLKDKII